jgi:hypothetical protein
MYSIIYNLMRDCSVLATKSVGSYPLFQDASCSNVACALDPDIETVPFTTPRTPWFDHVLTGLQYKDVLLVLAYLMKNITAIY